MLPLLLTTAVVIVAVTADGVAMPTLRHKASQKTCVQGRPYELNYDVTLIDSTFLDLDDPHTGLKDVECDLDQTRLRLIFKDSGKLLDFEKKLVGGAFKAFVTSKFNWPSCPRNVTGNNQALIRRVTSWLPELYEHKLKMQATASRYDEVMQDGTISFGAVQGTCEEEVDQPICIGLNVDDNCHQTAGPIPIYQNQFVDLECSNCFVGFGADVFVDVKLSGWELASLDAGFRNMTLDAATIFDLKATADWSTGVDKTYPIVPQTTLIDFKVGPLPFRFTFEVPLRITADASFHADAEAIAGATANISLGELAVHWDPTNHWSHNVPKPVMSWAPYIAGTEPEFNAEASLAVIPSATMKLNDILTYSLTAQPQLDLKLYGSVASKQICSNTTADLTLSAHTELHIDIDWLHVHTDKEWDKTFYDSGIVHLEDKCVPI